jgi:SSS family solute:Na+ symporter/sodium/pantothenate symporter
MGAFWRRATAAGALAAMGVGTATTVGLYVLGYLGPERLGLAFVFGPNPDVGYPPPTRPYYLWNLDPCVWGLSASLFAGIFASLLTPPTDPRRVANLFDADATAPASFRADPTRGKAL